MLLNLKRFQQSKILLQRSNTRRDCESPRANSEESFFATHRRLIAEAVKINLILFGIVAASSFSQWFGVVGGISIVLFLLIRSLRNPEVVFYVLFGIKLTFDSLWFLKPFQPLGSSVGLLELILIPLAVVFLIGPKINPTIDKAPLVLAFLFMAWMIIARLVNGFPLTAEQVVRQSGMFLGLVLGVRYVRNREQIDLLILLIFVSTVIPTLVGILQYAVPEVVSSIVHYKVDTIRGLRPSGLYYDPATSGMVSIMSLLSGFYLTRMTVFRRKTQHLITIVIFFNVILALWGGTRSVVFISALILLVLSFRSLATAIKLVPLAILLASLTHASVNDIYKRFVYELPSDFRVTYVMSDDSYRQLGSGRVSIWQDMWSLYQQRGDMEQLFGAGVWWGESHSTFFFLLLQIGALGLFFYLIIHWLLLRSLWRVDLPNRTKAPLILALLCVLGLGLSATTVLYTSFQWFIYILIGAGLNLRPWEIGYRPPLLRRV